MLRLGTHYLSSHVQKCSSSGYNPSLKVFAQSYSSCTGRTKNYYQLAIKYSRTHEWVHLEGTVATVGLTKHAIDEYGDIVYIDLPAKGKSFKAGEVFGTLEAVKATSDIHLPISGSISEVNGEAKKNLALINKDPMNKGWLVKINAKNKDEVNKLLTKEDYMKLIEKKKKS